MTTDYLLPKPSKRCAATGREFEPGERFHSVVSEAATGMVRKDYALDAWPDEAENALADWIANPQSSTKAQPAKPISSDDMLDWFDRLARRPDPSSIRLRYVFCLLLIQRRALKLLESYDAGAGECLVVERPDGDRRETVLVPKLTDEQIEQLEQQLEGLLRWGELDTEPFLERDLTEPQSGEALPKSPAKVSEQKDSPKESAIDE